MVAQHRFCTSPWAPLDDVSIRPASCAESKEMGMATYLRVYPRRSEHSVDARQAPSVRVRVGDLFPLLAQAHRGNYIWLNDFEDDEIAISPDLYEILNAYRC